MRWLFAFTAAAFAMLGVTGTGEEVEVPRDEEGRPGRRLPRHQGRRPVPLARGRRPQVEGRRRLGRGREQGHQRLPREPSPSARRSRSGITELWNYEKYLRPVQGGRPVLLHARTTACRTRASCTCRTRSTASRACCSTRTRWSQGRHRRPGRHWRSATTASTSPTASPRPARDWNTWKVLDVDTGKPLADELKWVKFSGAVVDAGRQGLLLQPLPRAEEGRRRSRA